MQCEKLKIQGGGAFVCGRRLPKARPCFQCGMPPEFQCDYPVERLKNGKFKTCDRLLCFRCAQPGISPDVDFCSEHYPLAEAAFKRRQAWK